MQAVRGALRRAQMRRILVLASALLVVPLAALVITRRGCQRSDESLASGGLRTVRKSEPSRSGGDNSLPILFSLPSVIEKAGIAGGELSGWVLDADSEAGVAGATVTMGTIGTLHTTTTDANGAFVFRPSRAGEYRLVGVAAPKFETEAWVWEQSRMHVLLTSGKRISDVRIFLRERMESECAGEVIFENGDGASGALVHSLRTSGAAMSTQSPPTNTDRNGSFTIACSPNDVLDAELGDLRGRASPSRSGRSLVILSSTPRLAISGSVVDSEGVPTPDVRIRADGVDAAAGTHMTSQTDSNGHFTFESLSSGTYEIAAVTEAGFVASRIRVEAPTRNVALRMEPLGTLRLRCRIAGSGTLPAMFEVRTSRGLRDGMTTTEGRVQLVASSTGELSVSGLPPGNYKVRVVAAGFMAAALDVTIVAHEARIQDVLLQRRGEIRAVVRDAENKRPIGGAKLVVHDWSTAFRENSASQSLWTGEDGRFLVTATTAAMRLVVSAPGYRDWTLTTGDQAPADLEVELEPAGATAPTPQFGGVGLVLSETLQVLQVLPSSPARSSGVEVGDQLRSVDGIAGLSEFEARSRIQGAPGSAVHLVFTRSDGGTHDATITRQRLFAK